MNEDIDYESWITREVYAHYGLAMYHGQTVEKGIVNLLVFLNSMKETNFTLDQWDKLTQKKHKQTMGKLKNELKNEMSISEDFKKHLTDLVDIRNFLAHQFFWDRAVKFYLIEGKKELIDELNEYIVKFKAGNIYLEEKGREIFKLKGFTDEMFEEMLDKTKESLIQEERNHE